MIVNNYEIILESINKHADYRQACLNLIASENIMSPMAKQILSCDLSGRYVVGKSHNRWFPGFEYFDNIEDIAEKITQKLFHANYANVQAPTGMIANMVAYAALLKPGDLVLSLSLKNGGHYSHVTKNILSLFQARVKELPFFNKDYVIDVEKAKKMIEQTKPKMIILGTSEFLFPAPIKELRDTCNKLNTKILYDASHVSGLIAGQIFQDPMNEGADIITLSTNKTLSAPSHGIIAYNDVTFEGKIAYGMLPNQFVSNNHPHHIAALAVTLAEFEIFGNDYAKQVVSNAKALAKALYAEGIAVLCQSKDFTQSHTILFDALSPAQEFVKRLAEVHIMTNALQLPWNQKIETGIRLGTSEITRLGMKEKEMKIISYFIAAAIFKRRSQNKICEEVQEFRRDFQKIYYCFNKEENRIN